MTTTTTQPVAVLEPWKVLRRAFVLIAVLAIGIGAGMLLDSGRKAVVEAGGPSAATLRLQGLADHAAPTPAERMRELADSLIVTPRAAPLDTRSATYDPAAAGVVFGAEQETTPAQRLQELADSLIVTPQAAPIDTRGATYDPAAGGVVWGRVEGASAASLRWQGLAEYHAPTPTQRMQELADSLIVTPQEGPIETGGATYDPAAGGVVYPQ
jgi:hypothetical protein